MSDYYETHYQTYYEETVSVDPERFLMPLIRRLSPGVRVLDVGCGSGRDLKWLGDRGFSVIGLERSPGLAALARRHAGCPVIDADFQSFDFSALSVDGICLIGALVHLPHPEMVPTLSRVARALNPAGAILISMKGGEGRVTDDRGRIFYLWSDEALRTAFGAAGFEVADAITQTSAVRATDVWHGYILTRG